MLKNRRQLGLTLIELLVVCAIVGVLALLAAGALQSARESARKIQCLNHLRQIGVGLTHHHSVHQSFPFGSQPQGWDAVAGYHARGALSIHVQLLASIDQQPLFNSINAGTGPRAQAVPELPIAPQNSTAKSTLVEVFLCPSDFAAVPDLGTSYRGCVGSVPIFQEGTPSGGGGAFPGLFLVRDRDFADGLSQTVGFSERVRGSDLSGKGRFTRRRDIWFTGGGQRF
jgi:prepilin-type N-terminal cleavage/methylation domain-containing protein